MRNPESASHRIVRTYAPRRHLVIVSAIAALGGFGLYVIYELGRYDAGYDRLAVSQQRAELEVVIEGLQKDNRELHTRLAALDTTRIGWAREQAEVSRTIGDLQAQVARQGQDLAFYRGVADQSPTSFGIKIQQLRVGATNNPRAFHLHLTLVRSVRPDDVVNGSVALRIEGESSGKDASVELSDITDGKLHDLPFSFRYYENLDPQITLPEGLKPERVSIEVRSSRKGVPALSQVFLWNVDAL